MGQLKLGLLLQWFRCYALPGWLTSYWHTCLGACRLCVHCSNYGEYIDRFDVVMRMNGAPTRGWEKQVGSKTTHRFVNNAYVGWREKDEVLISKWSGR